MTDLGNATQARLIADQVADAAITRFHQMHPPPPPAPERQELPPTVKWMAAAIGALGTAALIGMCLWVVSTLSTLQQTVTRIDERQQITATDRGEMKVRLDRIEERLARLEHQGSEAR